VKKPPAAFIVREDNSLYGMQNFAAGEAKFCHWKFFGHSDLGIGFRFSSAIFHQTDTPRGFSVAPLSQALYLSLA
jgi:hypothetical protein